MVDITRCEACGRVIPATEHGCAYCDRERAGEVDEPYLPLAVRLLLLLFVLHLAASMGLGGLTLLGVESGRGDSGTTVFLGLVRILVAGATLVALLKSRPWGRWFPLAFIVLEVLLGLSARVGWLPREAWRSDLLAPLWSFLFLFLFLRPDVQGRFDPRVWDRQEVTDLIRVVQKGDRDET
jgi:hypothetical protein